MEKFFPFGHTKKYFLVYLRPHLEQVVQWRGSSAGQSA